MMKHPLSLLFRLLPPPPELTDPLLSSSFCAELPLPLPENCHRAVFNVYLNHYSMQDLEWRESGTASPGASDSQEKSWEMGGEGHPG